MKKKDPHEKFKKQYTSFFHSLMAHNDKLARYFQVKEI